MKRKACALLLMLAMLAGLTGPILATEEDAETFAEYTYPYTTVYEPETSWPMAATVAWRADETAVSVAAETVRPATAFVWLDRDLKVYDRNDTLLSEDLGAYVDGTVSGMIPAFYIRDGETAQALKEWLRDNGLRDCFVVSTPENKDLVRDVADLTHVRGMLDYSAVPDPDRAALTEMVASTNGAHGKVILLSARAATRENVRLLQSLASTVWVRAPGDTGTLMALYASGVNGVLVDDYRAAIETLELFRDEAPSLLRVPLIIGHRGDPSSYVENTLDSARGAFEEGADCVESDIHLSRDGQLIIYHDSYPNELMGIPDTDEEGVPVGIDSFSLEELEAHTFPWENILRYNVVPQPYWRHETLFGQEEEKAYTVPTLEAYIQTFKDTGLILDTEIKSLNPEIVPAFRDLVNDYDAWDQFFCITFNEIILEEIYHNYPEISIGALCFPNGERVLESMTCMDNYEEITRTQGVEAAVEALCRDLDRWNATYNPQNRDYGREMVRAARHRGVTAWPWTYDTGDPETFARDYLGGVAGLACNMPWMASDLIVEIDARDVTATSVSAIPRPIGITQDGSTRILSTAEPLILEDLSQNRQRMIWRYRTDLGMGEDGDYYLYSAPFVYTEDDPARQFTDVRPGAWYTPGIRWALSGGILQGVGDTAFQPAAPATRAMLVSALWRMAGRPRAEHAGFTDVPENSWYSGAVDWAAETGVTRGVSDTEFAPGAVATREQVAAILYRFLKLQGRGYTEDWTFPEGYSDEEEVSGWAREAMSYMVEQGIIRGTEQGTLSPSGQATRAQLASMLRRVGE